MPPNPNVFDPPTAEQLSAHLEQNPPTAMTGWRGRVPILVMAAMALSLLFMSHPLMAFVPWAALVGLMIYLSGRVRAVRDLHARVTRAWELAMLRRHREALGQAWELLPACRAHPDLHGRAVTIMAHVLGELARFEAADRAYAYLLDRLPPEHPMATQLRVQRAVAALCGDRLADADDQLRRLRGTIDQQPGTPLAASYRLARLLQDVRTGHFADAAQHADDTADALRPLGVEAGYGHGLLALCFHQLSVHDPAGEDPAQRSRWAVRAKTWWDHATLLIPAAALVYRYHDLRPMLAEMTRQSPQEQE